DLDAADVGADGFDDADGFVSHPAARVAVWQCLVGPQIAAADGSTVDADQGVGGCDQAGVGDGLDTDVPGAEHDGCAQMSLPPVTVSGVAASCDDRVPGGKSDSGDKAYAYDKPCICHDC